jgi:hypothetical protein
MIRGAGEVAVDQGTLVKLVRLTGTEPGLRAVWLEAHREAEPVFAAALARRVGLSTPDLVVRVHAAVINASLRTAVEYYAGLVGSDDEPEGLEAVVSRALLVASRGFSCP